MRRWVLIIMLLVYPFQVALAMADKCCVTTPAGVTHHSAEQGAGATSAEPVFLADDENSALADPHCPACTFGHSFYLPSDPVVMPAERHPTLNIAFIPPSLTSPPVARLERPKWPAAAH
jgi:hypothetical protein